MEGVLSLLCLPIFEAKQSMWYWFNLGLTSLLLLYLSWQLLSIDIDLWLWSVGVQNIALSHHRTLSIYYWGPHPLLPKNWSCVAPFISCNTCWNVALPPVGSAQKCMSSCLWCYYNILRLNSWVFRWNLAIECLFAVKLWSNSMPLSWKMWWYPQLYYLFFFLHEV